MQAGTANADLMGEGGSDIRDIVPPVPIWSPRDWLVWILLLSALLAGAMGLVWWWRRRRPCPEVVEKPNEPPHERAKWRLQVALSLLDQPKAFCVEVSDALRWYLEERLELRAPERTTEEFLNELAMTDRLRLEQKATLAEFLRRCDLVKFARYEPSREELLELHGVAMQLIEETALMEGSRSSAASMTREESVPSARGTSGFRHSGS
ncbi:MAG: hypothetical protein RMN51_00735 [Verrucomicrobiota bacterium]|nr:hypothetical protein [Limisphaera sp.]MDW8380626.1 hypothetical protein [Verrucomicrobiota bacterium]